MIKASDVIALAESCIGIDKRKVIDTYNAHKPLAIGHVVQYYEPWCDTFLSYLYIVLDAVDLIGGTECGVERHIQLFKAIGIWEEDGTIIPKPGDIICYNWDDTTQPNDGWADHIGLVKAVDGNRITLIEGNYNDRVAERTIDAGDGCIRGYAQPKYEEQPVEEKKHLYGIDIASHQARIDTEKIEADFIIVKATQGGDYTNPYFRTQIDGAIKSGKIAGVYHYATGAGVSLEVEHFLKVIRDYIGKAFLCLDWETSTNPAGKNSAYWNPGYALRFMQEVKARTGLTMFVYGSKDSCFNAMDWSSVASAGFKLWGAQYKDDKPVYGYQSDTWQSSKPWGAWGSDVAIHQYTSHLRLNGYNGDLDGNICYLTADELKPYITPQDVTIWYRAHVQTYGWMDVVKNGEIAGTVGESKRLEAIKITPPDGVELEVDAHMQGIGWKTYKVWKGENSGTGSSANDPIIGTVGESRRLEALRIRCLKNPTGKALKYQAHVQTYGWMRPCDEGDTAGTTGVSKRLEAIKIWFE